MTKLRAFMLFLPLAIVAAGLFGALHDQVSYSVSSEYFARFKFVQFGLLDSPLPPRLRVAEVGFLASWWMGIPLGLLIGVSGLVQRSGAKMWRALLWSLLIALGVTSCVALAGLAYGYSQTQQVDLSAYSGWYVPPKLENPATFPRAGYMHNAAYLGGLVAVLAAWLFQGIYRRVRREA